MKQQGEKKAKAVVVTDPGLLNRTSWTNATVALTHIKKVRPDERCLGERDQTQPCVLRRLTLCCARLSRHRASGHLDCLRTQHNVFSPLSARVDSNIRSR